MKNEALFCIIQINATCCLGYLCENLFEHFELNEITLYRETAEENKIRERNAVLQHNKSLFRKQK